MGFLLDDAKSETWFVDPQNSSGLLPKGLSKSVGIDNLMELDGIQKSDYSTNLEAQNDNLGVNKHSIASNVAPLTYFGGATTISSIARVNTATVTSEHLSRVISHDEKSDNGAQTGLWKPPLPLKLVQRKLVDVYSLPSPNSKHTGGYSLQSLDFVARYLIPDQIFALDSTIFL
ncbi:Uncharacterized protein Adt_15354 [Abeliophyllum distichum]|uniref:Uncharacterized protein n=1 Tax=Abeliophyllum distichum TaxID=126358 RepID=A0ABD1U278_9LAMI